MSTPWAGARALALCVRGVPAAKIGFDCGVAGVFCPVGWGGVPEDVPHVQSCAALNKEAHHLVVAGAGSLVQGRGMGMAADWVVAIGIFAGVEEQVDDRDVTEVGCQRERQMAVMAVGGRKQAAGIFKAA